ncbi:hypothetical protein GGS21DRAFT_526456 [Xylaria nigripes]|nr:hypothetical protein GGS21DRAFT_526456 [Xylaria nigripes]
MFKPFTQSIADFSLLQTAVINTAPTEQTVDAGWISYPNQIADPPSLHLLHNEWVHSRWRQRWRLEYRCDRLGPCRRHAIPRRHVLDSFDRRRRAVRARNRLLAQRGQLMAILSRQLHRLLSGVVVHGSRERGR